MPETFSQFYLASGDLRADSERLRRRLGAYCDREITHRDGNLHIEIIRRIETETGVRVPWKGTMKSLDVFFQQAELRDVLDAVTHIYQALIGTTLYANHWLSFSARAFREEFSAYDVQNDGSVRYKVDDTYAFSRITTLKSLSDEKWSTSRSEFERAFEAMDRSPVDTNGAIRAISVALESAAKQVVGGSVSRIGPSEIERYLWPLVREHYVVDSIAQNAAHEFLKAYASWTNATHQYRHGQAGDIAQAPFELTVTFLSHGAAILRWLVTIFES